MKLKTLNYIHNLLINNALEAKEDYSIAVDDKHRSKEMYGEDSMTYQTHKEACSLKLDVLNEAEEALIDFEEQEW